MAKVEKKAPNKYVILAPVVVIVALLIMFFLYSGSVANYKRTGFLNVRGDVTKDSEAIINLAWEKVEKAYGYEDGYSSYTAVEKTKLWFNKSYHYVKYTFTYQDKVYEVILPYSYDDKAYLVK